MFWVYVDEGGNRSISPRSSRYFVVSAVMVHEAFNDEVRDRLGDLKVALGRHRHQILHFRNLRPKSKRLEAAEAVAAFPIARVMNVIVDKAQIAEEGPAGDVSFISQADPMYLWALRLILERVSWYARAWNEQDLLMTFSHVRGVEESKLTAYREALERQRNDPGMSIEWDLFDAHRFVVTGPKAVDLLQVADVTASSVFHAIEPNADGRQYLDALTPVNGHRFLPSGGHPTSPLTATSSPHPRPRFLPA